MRRSIDTFTMVLLSALILAMPVAAQERKEGETRTELDNIEANFTFSLNEQYDIDQLLQMWGRNLKHIIVSDAQIRGQKLKLLTQQTTMTWNVFKKILVMNGIIIVEQEVTPGQLLIKAYLQRNLQTNESPPFLIVEKDKPMPQRWEIVTAVVQVKNGAGREIFGTVRGLLTRDRNRIGEILHVPGPEVILITDFAPNVEYYSKIIVALDIRAPGQDTKIRKMAFAIPSEVAQVLSQIFQSDSGFNRPIGFQVAAGTQVAQPQFIAHDPTGKLIIRAYAYQAEEIDRLIGELDVRVKEETGKFHVYKCQSAKAENLAEKLQELFSNRITNTRTGGAGATGARRTTPAPAAPIGGGGGGAAAGANPNQQGIVGPITTRIVADQRTNQLLIQAEEDDYQAILKLLRQLDKKRQRVFIEAMVWEISANDDLTIATELAALSNPHQGSVRPLAATSFGLSDVTITDTGVGRDVTSRLQQGITAILTKDRFDRLPIILNVLARQSQSKKITTPFAITDDNDQATFRVNDRVPFNTTTVNNVASQQNVQFVDATSSLAIAPQVNSADNLTLDVNLTISSFGARASPNLPPSQNSREYRGRVTVPNGKYIVFGGLDSESDSVTEMKLPLLGDIPYLGHLFKSWLRSQSKSKVYIFIRPVIFVDENFREDIQATEFLRKKAHLESEREEWLPPIIPDPTAPKGAIQDKVFELFGTGSGNPFE